MITYLCILPQVLEVKIQSKISTLVEVRKKDGFLEKVQTVWPTTFKRHHLFKKAYTYVQAILLMYWSWRSLCKKQRLKLHFIAI